jgi:hypothetical protein
MLVFPYAARAYRLGAFVRSAYELRLFTNLAVPSGGSTAADFVEPDAKTGYAPLRLNPAGWRLENVGPAVRAIAAPGKFMLPTGKDTKIYGHFTVDAQGQLLWADRLQVLHTESGIWKLEPFEFLRPEDELELTLVVDSIDQFNEETAE